MIELEKTYLAKYLPEGLNDCSFKEILDIYIPGSVEHPNLRIRKNGNNYEMTKKEPVNDGDASEQVESTIILTPAEFADLEKLDGKRVRKLRYYYDYNGRTAEIDVFQDGLEGLVEVDFEFDNPEDKNNFEMPEFCLVDVTQELFTAGGILCGKSYDDIQENLDRFNYKKLSL